MKRYTFTLEETQEIKAAREKNRDKNVEKRLAALEMRAEGKRNKEISEKTGFHTQYITVLVSRYKANGLANITESHYHGNHRNLSYEEEKALLEPFRLDSNVGKMVSVHDFKPYGCETGICAHANNNSGGQCFCDIYHQTIVTQESCPYFQNFFDTEMGEGLLR